MSTMRRKDKEIKEKAVLEEILRENQVGRLGTAVDGRPYVVPMNFVYTNDRIILHTHRDGKKVKDIQRNPRVCFEVDLAEAMPSEDPCGYSFRYRSVIANGRAEVIEDPRRRVEALRLLVEKYAPGRGAALTEKRVSRFKNLVVVEITIDEMVGKRSPA